MLFTFSLPHQNMCVLLKIIAEALLTKYFKSSIVCIHVYLSIFFFSFYVALLCFLTCHCHLCCEILAGMRILVVVHKLLKQLHNTTRGPKLHGRLFTQVITVHRVISRCSFAELLFESDGGDSLVE